MSKRLELAEAFAARHLADLPVFGMRYLANVKSVSDKISTGLNHNSELLYTSIFLYNLGIGQAITYRQDAQQTSLTLAKKFLETNNFKAREIEQILHCIKEHPLKGRPRTNEAKILHDADLLERIGSFGILGSVYLAGAKGKSLKETLSELKQMSELLDISFYTRKARELAKERTSNFRSFLESLDKELL